MIPHWKNRTAYKAETKTSQRGSAKDEDSRTYLEIASDKPELRARERARALESCWAARRRLNAALQNIYHPFPIGMDIDP